MSRNPHRTQPHSRLFDQIAGVAAALLGGGALLGWWLNNEALKSIVPGSSPLKPNIAAGMSLCGGALVFLSLTRSAKPARICAALAGSIVLVLGGLTLGEHFLGWNLGIDQWLIAPGAGGTSPMLRMVPATAICFVLMGIAFIAQSHLVSPRLGVPLAGGLSMALVFIGTLALGGFFLETLFGPRWNLLGMNVSGLTAAVGFLLIGSGLLALLRSEHRLFWSLDTLTTAGFALGVLLMVIAAGAAFNHTRRMLETTTSLTHRQEVLQKVQKVLTDVTDLLSQERVYVILGDERILSGREQTQLAVKDDLLEVRKLTVDNPNQQRRLDQLGPLIMQRIDWEEKIIAARRDQGFPVAAQMIEKGVGMRLSEEAFRLLQEMEDEEHTLLARDKKQAETTSLTAFSLLPFGVFLSLAILSLGLFFLNAGVTEQKQAEKALRESEAQLQTIVENLDEGVVVSDLHGRLLRWNQAALRLHGYSDTEQDRRSFTELIDTFELSTLEGAVLPLPDWPLARILRDEKLHDLELRIRRLGDDWRRVFNYGGSMVRDSNGNALLAIVTLSDVTERKRAESSVRQLNAELEQRVIQRTEELEAANKELEAFSYSVSHDLRAPLRAVDGFSQAVLEDFGGQLPEEGRHYLQTIRGGAQRMGALIDDLLTFSRLSRLPLNKRKVNTERLVRDTLAELGFPIDARKIEMRIDALPACLGDAALLKQVWLNLLSNALKYTRQRESAVIEVGCTRENGNDENIYFVRDNGTGFDMHYSNKLFGVFQRLHRADEFEGTGVGLAIVQRIVHRHGGRVWADATLDRGATFYFTLEGNITS